MEEWYKEVLAGVGFVKRMFDEGNFGGGSIRVRNVLLSAALD